jgi:hypothetical protein
VLLAGLNAGPDLAPWLIAAAMTITGAGGGFVISPNQTITLAEVPVTQGGVAGSMAQVGQRAGTAIGVAAVISTFYATLYAEGDSEGHVQLFRDGFLYGMLVALGLVLVALVIAGIDLIAGRASGAFGRR